MKNRITALLISIFFLTIFNSCDSRKSQLGQSEFNNRNHRIVIWTSCSEVAQYAELYNKNSKDSRVIIVYKENPALSLPPAKDEELPDLILGSWLHTDSMQKNFRSLDYLFDRQNLNSAMFYENLLNAGKFHRTQYLLPVSFNLPAVIFDKVNSSLITDDYMLSLEQIRRIGAEYNQRKKNNDFSRIGFTVLNDNSFLSLTAKLYGADFREFKNKIVWNNENLEESVNYLRDWIVKENQSAQTEEDFAYKYLFMPYYRQVSSGRTLFAFTQSDAILKVLHAQELQVDYRWIVKDGKITMEDSFMMMGIYKNAQNIVGASDFITWFFKTDTQRQIIERKGNFLLETELFGIAGGFSAVRDVTEHVLPIFYTQLLSNLPPAQMIEVPQKLPPRWDSYKTQVLEQYMYNQLTARNPSEKQTIDDFEREWRKKLY